MKAIKITTDDVISVVDVEQPLHLSLRSVIDGYLEIVRPRGLMPPFCIVVDEEGLLKNKPVNFVGSVLYETHKRGAPIVGDIVIMREEPGPEGYDLFGLGEQDIKDLAELAEVILKLRKEEGT